MRLFSRFCRFFVVSCVICYGALLCGAVNAQTVHLITVGDLRGTDSEGWRRTIAKDVQAIQNYFESNSSVDGFKYYEVDGKMATPDAIRAKISEIKAAKDDVIVFYYSGHAANDPAKDGHYFQLSDANGNLVPLFRTEIRDLLQAKGARLVVLITDCCNPFYSSEFTVGSSKSGETTTLFHQLFIAPQGTLDYTSSAIGQSSLTGKDGGNSIGTYALLKALDEFAQKTNADSNLVVTWKDVVDRASELSDEAFQEAVASSNLRIDQKTQKPHVYEWPKAPRFGVRAKSLEEGGVKITSTLPDFPGEKAGLQAGDVIVSISGKTIVNETDYSDAIDGIGSEAQDVPMEYMRNGRKSSVNVKFLEQTKTDPPAFGAVVRNGDQGAQVSNVVNNSPAANAGIERGDEILKVNGAVVKGTSDFSAAIDRSNPQATLEIRDPKTGQIHTIKVGLHKPFLKP